MPPATAPGPMETQAAHQRLATNGQASDTSVNDHIDTYGSHVPQEHEHADFPPAPPHAHHHHHQQQQQHADFSNSDDDSVEAELPPWSPETLPIGGGASSTPSPTAFAAAGGGGGDSNVGGRRSGRSSGSGSSGGRGGGEEDEGGSTRTAEARAAATAMFSQLPGTMRPQTDSGCVASEAPPRSETDSARRSLFGVCPASSAT